MSRNGKFNFVKNSNHATSEAFKVGKKFFLEKKGRAILVENLLKNRLQTFLTGQRLMSKRYINFKKYSCILNNFEKKTRFSTSGKSTNLGDILSNRTKTGPRVNYDRLSFHKRPYSVSSTIFELRKKSLKTEIFAKNNFECMFENT